MNLELKRIEEQAVLSTRLAHRMLITVSVTALLFVYSPASENVLQAEVGELNQLLRLDTNALILEALERHDTTKTHLQQVRAVLGEYNLSLYSYMGLIEVDRSNAPPNMDQSTLDDIDNYFSSRSQLKISIATIDDALESALRELLEIVPGHGNMPARCQGVVSLKVSTSSNDLSVTCPESGGPYIRLPTTPHVETFAIPFDVLDLIAATPQSRSLVSEEGEDLVFLPKVRTVWDQVRLETPARARTILARQNSPEERTLQMFGLSVPQNLILWAIPVITLALSVYFLVHATYLCQLVERNPAVREYPWVVVMPGRLAFVVSTATVLVLPAIALVSSVITTWSSGGTFLHSLSLIATTAAMSFLVLCSLEFSKIRHSPALRS